MTEIEKPRGYDIRSRRQAQREGSREWTAQDALYEAHVETEPESKMLILWWTEEGGKLIVNHKAANLSMPEAIMLMRCEELELLLEPGEGHEGG